MTASRLHGFDMLLPTSFNSALTGNTCSVHLDMASGRETAVDTFYLSDVAFAAQLIMDECLTTRLLAPATTGWMSIGRFRIVNVTLAKLHVPLVPSGNRTDSVQINQFKGEMIGGNKSSTSRA